MSLQREWTAEGEGRRGDCVWQVAGSGDTWQMSRCVCRSHIRISRRICIRSWSCICICACICICICSWALALALALAVSVAGDHPPSGASRTHATLTGALKSSATATVRVICLPLPSPLAPPPLWLSLYLFIIFQSLVCSPPPSTTTTLA